MSDQHSYSYHLIEERQFRERFLPAVQGEEPIVRELLEAANAAGPSWTALHKMFDATRAEWLQAVERADGEAAQRTVFAAFAQFMAHLRPAYCVKGFSLAAINPAEFTGLASRVRSPGLLLTDSEGAPLPGVTESIPARVPNRCLDGRSGGGFIPAAEVRSFLDAFRTELPRLVNDMPARGVPAEAGLTVFLSALVEAKLQGKALLEACDVLVDDTHLPSDHLFSFDEPETLPPAVVREIARAFGKAPAPTPKPAAPAPKPAAPEAIDYSPRLKFEVGQRIRHKNFGVGTVTEVLDGRRFQAQFDAGEKDLVQGLKTDLTPSTEDLDPVE